MKPALGALWHAAHAVSDCGAAEKIDREHRRSCAPCSADALSAVRARNSYTVVIPGKFPSVTDALVLARESGLLAGLHKERSLRGPRRDPLADEARQLRRRAQIAASGTGWRVPEAACYVRVTFMGCPRWDADAGGYALKAIIDGLFGHYRDRRVWRAWSDVARTPLAPGAVVDVAWGEGE